MATGILRAGMLALVVSMGVWAGCSASSSGGGDGGKNSGGTGNTAGDAQAGGSGGATGGTSGTGGSGGVIIPDASGDAGTGGGPPAPDPTTCDEAKQQKSYVGCDFWPTVLPNPAWEIFDFAIAIANSGTDVADVTVTRGSSSVATTQVQSNGLSVVFLPWVTELKGTQADVCASGNPPTASVRSNGGAYHVVSTKPVTVWQYSPIEAVGVGGPSGKDWSACPGNQTCPAALYALGCNAFTADASILLPSTAMTGNYRVTTYNGWAAESVPTLFAITATADATTVKVKVSSTGEIAAGTGITGTPKDGILQLTLAAGDVVQLVGTAGGSNDLSGSLVQADKPVQVLAGASCMQVPQNVKACDHIEESVLPAETLGKHYFVARPTGPNGTPVGHVVRIYGNVDGTKLSYPSVVPLNAPAGINAGQMFDMGVVDQDFEITGDHEFSVATFQQGGAAVDPLAAPGTRKGDPSQSQCVAVEQWRQKYIFIAPNDYVVSYADIVQPVGANLVVDGSPGIAPVPIGTSGFGVARVKLSGGAGGVHLIAGDQPFSIQVEGYSPYVSYQYPGGFALQAIAPPPPVIK